MSVLGIVSEIVQNEELEEEKSYYEHHRRNKNIGRDKYIINSVDDAGTDDSRPKPLNTLDAGIVFPSKCLLTERKVPRIVDKS